MARFPDYANSEIPALFRTAMRRVASTVAIVVARGPDGPVGITATSITSLTVDPPAVLVCVNRAASLHALLQPAAPLSVNILSRHQQTISAAFGGALPRADRFDHGTWQEDPECGLPALMEAQVNLLCIVDAMLAYGTHTIAVARVENVRVNGEVAPLIYQDGTYL